jgi:dual specificity tyrosine-phosphorylation-regulated kinase 2/3/4
VPNPPIAPAEAREKYAALLTPSEVSEIEDFPEVYYLGDLTKKVRAFPTPECNHGYDDARHHYRCVCGDHIAYRFEIRSHLGKGAFGQVVRVFDHKTKTELALKVIVNTKQMHDQGHREIALLDKMTRLPEFEISNIVQTTDFFTFRSHICVAFEILGSNLFEYSRALRFRPIETTQLRSMARAILKGLAFLHRNSVVHCDIKPENLLLVPHSMNDVRLIDFGSSCMTGQHPFEYVQSRFYRAPEVILGLPYGPPMDMWGFGCVLGELATGKPVFPGANEREQVRLLTEVLGPMPPEMASAGGKGMKVLALAKKKRTLRAHLRLADKGLVGLIRRALEWDQGKRITAEEALAHAWVVDGG